MDVLTASAEESIGRPVLGTRGKALTGGDLVAIVVLLGLPVVIFAVPALLGHVVLTGDDLTQNYPLRVLAGTQLRHGHLPLFDPYIWSGAPLLGGWNAGALYPLTFLFAVLPASTAWTVSLLVTWWVAALGTFAFLKASRRSSTASFLGALSFAFAGAMTAQIPHFGLVAGMSWVPLGLLALLRLSEATHTRGRLGWLVLLAATLGMVVLAGEPRSIDDAAIILAIYAAWRAWRLQPRGATVPYIATVAAGAVTGIALGAVQWLPGVAAVASSQRAAHSIALFESGSLPPKWLLLSLVPDLLGGSGSFGQPSFFATYNLTEVTGYVGLLPLVGAAALLGRIRWRRPAPEWVIWHVIALVGVLLALGGKTFLGPVLAHVPLFGDQRLQSRNIVITDLALAVLLAYWVDTFVQAPNMRWRRPRGWRHRTGLVPPVLTAAVVLATLIWGSRIWQWLGVDAGTAARAGGLRPWLVPSLVLAVGAIALVIGGPRLGAGIRRSVVVGFVVADIVVFTLLAVVEVAPTSAAGTSPTSVVRSSTPVVPVSRLTHGGRFAVYDPDQLDTDELTALGVADGNVVSRTPSIEGYGSIIDANYAGATGSHQATGVGQNVLDPRAIADGTLDQLSTTVLLTPSAYLLNPVKGDGATADHVQGVRHLSPGQTTTWYLGTQLSVTSVTVPTDDASTQGGQGLRLGLVGPVGSVDWVALEAGHPGQPAVAQLPDPLDVVALRVSAGNVGVTLGPPQIRTTAGDAYQPDGVLQDALVPPRWSFSGLDGDFAVFTDVDAKPALSMEPTDNGSTAGASIRATGGPSFAPTSALVSSAHGVTVVRAVADIPGWKATWRPTGTEHVERLPVRRVGLVQGVALPGGAGTLAWIYDPPGARVGLWVSLAALAVLVSIGLFAATRRRTFDALAGLRGWS